LLTLLLLVAAGHGPSVCLHLSFSCSSVFCFCLLFCCCYCCSYLLLLPPHWCVGTSLLGMAPGVSTCAAHPQGSQPPVRLCCCCCCPFCLELIWVCLHCLLILQSVLFLCPHSLHPTKLSSATLHMPRQMSTQGASSVSAAHCEEVTSFHHLVGCIMLRVV